MAKSIAAATDRAPEPGGPEAAAGGFYTPAEAARIARVPRPRLAAWRREGIAEAAGGTQSGSAAGRPATE